MEPRARDELLGPAARVMTALRTLGKNIEIPTCPACRRIG